MIVGVLSLHDFQVCVFGPDFSSEAQISDISCF